MFKTQVVFYLVILLQRKEKISNWPILSEGYTKSCMEKHEIFRHDYWSILESNSVFLFDKYITSWVTMISPGWLLSPACRALKIALKTNFDSIFSERFFALIGNTETILNFLAPRIRIYMQGCSQNFMTQSGSHFYF